MQVKLLKGAAVGRPSLGTLNYYTHYASSY
jgi:hypothetical protein